eukprot:jgi/Psemu1/8604/gm1.8604_g
MIGEPGAESVTHKTHPHHKKTQLNTTHCKQEIHFHYSFDHKQTTTPHHTTPHDLVIIILILSIISYSSRNRIRHRNASVAATATATTTTTATATAAAHHHANLIADIVLVIVIVLALDPGIMEEIRDCSIEKTLVFASSREPEFLPGVPGVSVDGLLLGPRMDLERPLRSSSLRSVHGHGDDHEDDHHKLDSYFGTDANVSKNFDWSDLPISNGVEGNCGADKCFWRSVSDPTTVGYLVASARYHYDRMRKAYDFAVDVLDATCHAKHLYLEPPELVRVEHGFAEHLNGLRQNRHYEYVDKIAPKPDGLRSRSDRIVYDATDPYLVVQKVRVAPDPSLAFGYMARKWDLLVVEDLPRFRTLLAERGTDLKTLEAKLETERRKIECAMDHSPTYWYDLQGLIDPDGNYHHMDVDSQFWVGVGDPTQPVDDDEGVKIVDQKETYDQRHELIGKFNEMIQRLVHPPPEGVDELPAWDDDGTA